MHCLNNAGLAHDLVPGHCGVRDFAPQRFLDLAEELEIPFPTTTAQAILSRPSSSKNDHAEYKTSHDSQLYLSLGPRVECKRSTMAVMPVPEKFCAAIKLPKLITLDNENLRSPTQGRVDPVDV